MQHPYMLDFNLSAAGMCLITLDPAYDKPSRQLPYFRHRHNAFEVHFIAAGSCTLRVGEEQWLLKAGELCLIAPGLFHSLKGCSEDFDRICLIFELTSLPKEDPDNETAGLIAALQSVRALRLPAGQMADTILRIREAALTYRQSTGGAAKLRTLLELFVIELAQRIDSGKSCAAEKSGPLDKQRGFLIDEFFHDRFDCNDGEKLLAKTLCVSCRQLNRILKRLYGKGFREKLLEARLEIAKDLLLTTDMSVAELSRISGYSCPANFSTFIKNATGKTPSEIREKTDSL